MKCFFLYFVVRHVYYTIDNIYVYLIVFNKLQSDIVCVCFGDIQFCTRFSISNQKRWFFVGYIPCLRVRNVRAMSKLIHELPWKVRFNVCLLLDQLEPPNHNWKSLIGELPNLKISTIEVNAVERQGQIPGKSPTEVLLNTLEHKNYTIDDLYRGLHKMEHRRAMDIIIKYGAHAHCN